MTSVTLLRDLEVVVLDCQATGATPELGDLLELGWATCRADAAPSPARPARASWIVPRSGRAVPRIVKKLTGWEDAFLAEAISEEVAWSKLRADVAPVGSRTGTAAGRSDGVGRTTGEGAGEGAGGGGVRKAVIHFASFELRFLRDLHARVDGATEFPFDAVCLHAIAQRLYPELPRRGLRALAGFLGHPAELVRRSAGHVEASAHVWRAFVPALEAAGVHTWEDLEAFVGERAPPRSSKKRVFPLPAEARRALTKKPGVYRFLRSNGDVLYVGKAASVRARVASHFTAASRARASGPNERVLEMLTQVSDVSVTETETALEAALLEPDEIKRLDPPYNIHLRTGDRRAWFLSPNLLSAASAPDDAHPIGPLPSADAVAGLAAIRALARGVDPTLDLVADAVGVPRAFAPDEALFREGFRLFVEEHAGDRKRGRHGERGGVAARDEGAPGHEGARGGDAFGEGDACGQDDACRQDGARAPGEDAVFRALLRAAITLWMTRGPEESSSDDAPPDAWDLARVRRRLDRSLVRGAQLLRRARWLALLSDSAVAFREPQDTRTRLLVIEGGEIALARDLLGVGVGVDNAVGAGDGARVVLHAPSPHRARRARQACFDATRYDRLRVLATELRRVHTEGGDVRVQLANHVLAGDLISRLLRAI